MQHIHTHKHTQLHHHYIFAKRTNGWYDDIVACVCLGDFIRAFYESFRRVNKNTFALLQQRLHASALTRHPLYPANDTCGRVASWLQRDLHFSDLSVQIHFGPAWIKGAELFWHNDAENSLLHFGVTLLGHRVLHSMRAATASTSPVEVREEQSPGDVYLSSSALMNHAPEYLPCDYSNRTVAIQARFMYSTEELKLLRQQRTAAGWDALTDAIALTLSETDLALPNMNDVDAVLKERGSQ